MTEMQLRMRNEILNRRLLACDQSLSEFITLLDGVNDPMLLELFAKPIALATKAVSAHRAAPNSNLADDIAAIRSEFARAVVSREDPILGLTSRLDRLRAARGALLAELDEVLLEAHNCGIKARSLAHLPETSNLSSHGLEPLLNGLANRIAHVESQLLNVRTEGEDLNLQSSQQNRLIRFYVDGMDLQVAIARFESLSRGLIDFYALGRAIEQMIDLTSDFLASAEGMRKSINDKVRAAARAMRPVVMRTSRGYKALLKVVRGPISGAPFQRTQPEWEISLLTSLDRAIDNGEVWVAYQPKLELRSNRICGVEALVRWTHPERGPISPDKFILIAEEFHRIERITRFVINDAVRVATDLERAGYQLTMSVNISAQLLRNPGLPDMISEILATHVLSPNRLILEITETDRLDRSSLTFQMLQRLVQSGLRLSIDDFGTGNATIDYLRYVPASEVKIDKTFISSMEGRKEDLLLVQSIIEMAHSLDRVVVAEGVETAAVLEMLRGIGCDLVQGYFLSRPVPFQQLIELLDAIKLESSS